MHNKADRTISHAYGIALEGVYAEAVRATPQDMLDLLSLLDDAPARNGGTAHDATRHPLKSRTYKLS